MENHNTETAYNCRQFPYFNFKWQNATKTCVLQWRTQIRKRPTIVGSFRNLKIKFQNAKKHAFGNGKRNMETAYYCGRFLFVNFKWQNDKKHAFLQIEDTNTETAYNCTQFPYLNFRWQNTKKHAFCEEEHEYGNSLQLCAVFVRKLPTILGIIRISILIAKTPKNMAIAMEETNTKTAYNCRQFPYLNFKMKKTPKTIRIPMWDTNTETA